jgi:hypothetical protein
MVLARVSTVIISPLMDEVGEERERGKELINSCPCSKESLTICFRMLFK